MKDDFKGKIIENTLLGFKIWALRLKDMSINIEKVTSKSLEKHPRQSTWPWHFRTPVIKKNNLETSGKKWGMYKELGRAVALGFLTAALKARR